MHSLNGDSIPLQVSVCIKDGHTHIEGIWIDWPFYLSHLWGGSPKGDAFKTLYGLFQDMRTDETYETSRIFSSFLRENDFLVWDMGAHDFKEFLTGRETYDALKESAEHFALSGIKLGQYPFHQHTPQK